MNRGVFIAMPAYRGADVVEETIRSILAQTFQDFHLVISIDGEDDPTIEICRKYADDPRIDVVVQEHRLGWPGNFNWLVRRSDREFFCYWQQDDLASTGYLETLRRELLARPDASIAYTDVQWFGARFDRTSTPSIEGDPLSRVMQHVEAIRYEPLRGLMRTSMLPSGPEPIPVTEDESCQEEFVFMAQLAAAGAFVRIDSAMYFKRLHNANAFVRWAHFPDWRRRRAWISMGAGMFRIARALAGSELGPRILSQLVDRLAIERHGRGHFYMPIQTPREIHRFVRDFVALARVHDDDLRAAEPGPLDRPVDIDVLRGLELVARSAALKAEHMERLQESGSITVAFGEEGDDFALGFGWSYPESWGTWSDGQEATLSLPVPVGSRWRAMIDGRVHAPNGPVTIGYGIEGEPLEYVEAAESVRIAIEAGPVPGSMIRFVLPEARPPDHDGLPGDLRTLGIGLTRFHLHLL